MRRLINITFVFLLLYGCVEPFDAQTETLESLLVIDAKLTDEEKQHEILLSRARPFEIDSTISERNAIVKIIDDAGTEFNFEETTPGSYVSTSTFSAKPNSSYQLRITTIDGSSYLSESVLTPRKTEIGQVYAEQEIQDNGEEGVSILLDNTSNSSAYKRYEYEETFKIVAPFYSPLKFEINSSTTIQDLENFDGIVYNPSDGNGTGETFFILVKPRDVDVSTCYSTRKSRDLVLGGSDVITTSSSSRFKVRFLNRNDYSISHRYSIMVKQLALTSEAYAYYTDLDDFASSESVFSQIQPGFLEGNIKSVEGSKQKVLGYFEVASVSTERLFFDYVDFFPNEPLPPYAINCEPIGAPPLSLESGHANGGGDEPVEVDRVSVDSPLVEGILAGLFVYHAENSEYEAQVAAQNEAEMNTDGLVPYFVKATACGDCTVLGSLNKPDFWEE